MLDSYTTQQNIWHPREGAFDVFILKQAYQTFQHLGKDTVIVVDDFFEQKKELTLDACTEREFVASIDNKDFYLYSADKELLFTVHWDSFFYLIFIK